MSKPLPPKTIPPLKKPKLKGKVKGYLNTYLVEILYLVMMIFLFFITIQFFSKHEYSFRNYAFFQIVILLVGILHAIGLIKWVSWANSYKGYKEIVTTIVLLLLGLSMVYLSDVLSFISVLPFNYTSALSFFLVPWFFMLTFKYFISIPNKYYQGWQYPYGKEVPVIEVIDPIKMKFYVSKQLGDSEYAEFELNVPQRYSLGDFMHYFLHRYNYDKNPENPIFISKDNKGEDLFDWIFYSKGVNRNKKIILDPNLSFAQLALGENENIVLERYFTSDQFKMKQDELSEDSLNDNNNNDE